MSLAGYLGVVGRREACGKEHDEDAQTRGVEQLDPLALCLREAKSYFFANYYSAAMPRGWGPALPPIPLGSGYPKLS